MHWVDTAASLLAQQHRATRHASCPEECCTALVFGHCTPLWIAKLDRCKCCGTTYCQLICTEQQGMHSALSSAALHWCLIIATFVWIAKLERCKCIGTTLLPACWHSSTEQQGMHFGECCTALVFADCNICVDSKI